MGELMGYIPALSLLLTLASFYVGRLSAKKNEGKQEATVLVELGHIKGELESIGKKFDRMETQYTDVMQRLTAVEESAKQAHKRIDEIREHCCGD